MNEERNTMEQEEVLICECCNYIIDDDDYTEWDSCSLPSKTQKSDTQNAKNRSDLSDLRKPERFFLYNIIF